MSKYLRLLLLGLFLCSPVSCAWMLENGAHPTVEDEKTLPVTKGEFRCLIVEETSQRSTYDPGQLSILTSVKVRQFMKEHCAKDWDGKTPEFKILDQNTGLTGKWLAIFQDSPPKSLPWFYVSDGNDGDQGPLPKGPDAVSDFLDKAKPFVGVK